MNNTYKKPLVLAESDLAEGVYTASGSSNSTIGCDSSYTGGVYHAPYWVSGMSYYEGVDYLTWYGCMGCPAYTDSGCGLASHYVDSGNATSYETDNGNRKPSWEAQGHSGSDLVTF